MTKDDEDWKAPTTVREQHSPFPTNKELKELIEKQGDILSKPNVRNDPPWLKDAGHDNWKEYRRVSRKITRQTNRLDKATKDFENDFDLSS